MKASGKMASSAVAITLSLNTFAGSNGIFEKIKTLKRPTVAEIVTMVSPVLVGALFAYEGSRNGKFTKFLKENKAKLLAARTSPNCKPLLNDLRKDAVKRNIPAARVEAYLKIHELSCLDPSLKCSSESQDIRGAGHQELGVSVSAEEVGREGTPSAPSFNCNLSGDDSDSRDGGYPGGDQSSDSDGFIKVDEEDSD